MTTKRLFPTLIYSETLQKSVKQTQNLNQQILLEAQDLKELDLAGKRWSKKNYPNGFTSYSSANQLQKQSSTFAKLEERINSHVEKFVKELEFDLQGGKLRMSNCWVNIMPQNSHHGLHIHPLSVISGTYYVKVPKDASGLKFEDPRMSRFMSMPPKKKNTKAENSTHFIHKPLAGSLVLFESWLGHEVPICQSEEERVSVSFNYEWV